MGLLSGPLLYHLFHGLSILLYEKTFYNIRCLGIKAKNPTKNGEKRLKTIKRRLGEKIFFQSHKGNKSRGFFINRKKFLCKKQFSGPYCRGGARGRMNKIMAESGIFSQKKP